MIKIGGFVPFTTIDFPGNMATVLFCQGCPLKCPYCHNLHLKSFTDIYEELPWNEIVVFLKKRQKMIDAVVFSGGEPLFQPDLSSAIRELKELNFKVALHTSGADDVALRKIYPMLDFIAMDFKLPFDKYDMIYPFKDKILSSLKMLVNERAEYEVRTTLDPFLLTKDDVLTMAEFLKTIGIKNYAVQLCRETKEYHVDIKKAYSFFNDDKFVTALKNIFPKVVFRK